MQIDDFPVGTFPAIEDVGLDAGNHPIRVCIATEEIIGPVRNGGIASTYYHLAKGLAAQGHEVHVLFLKGRVVQDETPEHWIAHYAEFGVTLHYLDAPEAPLWGAAPNWQGRYLAAHRWLLAQDVPFDVVHTSEWRGGLVYALMAKRLGLAFAETLFIVKTSSPHIWNRHYQMQPIDKADLVAAAHAEQKCVELADMVVGGSAHLISFMERIGYAVPRANVFVQPNIVDFSKVPVTDSRPPRERGSVVKTDELVFFGRLEGRKGIELFCNALDILRERGRLPRKVTFMGKWGSPLATQGGRKVSEYLEARIAGWPGLEVEIITDRNQPEALSHMCSRDMIAVMPSLIENSTMAVYETLDNNIPFIATAVGGTPELIDPADHAATLVPPKSEALADRLQAVLAEGQVIARPAFSNAANLDVWYGFHAYLGREIAAHGRAATVARLTAPVEADPAPAGAMTWAALLRPGDDPAPLAEALVAAAPAAVRLAYTGAGLRPGVTAALDRLRAAGIDAEAVDCIGLASGDALNALVGAVATGAMVLAVGGGVRPRPGFLEAAATGLARRPAAFVTAAFGDADGRIGLPMGGDVASQLLSARAYGPECIALTRARLETLGPLEPYDLRSGLLYEYVTRNVEAGQGGDLLVCPEVLLEAEIDAVAAVASDNVAAYLQAKPLIDTASLSGRKVLLAALGHAGREGGRVSLPPRHFRDKGRPADAPVWLVPSDWDRSDVTAAAEERLLVGLDEGRNRLWFYARGAGERQLFLDGAPVALSEPEEHGVPGGERVTLQSWDIPATSEPGSSYPMRWQVEGAGIPRQRVYFRATQVTGGTFALSARQPVWPETLLRALAAPAGTLAADAAPPADAPLPPERLLPMLQAAMIRAPGRPATDILAGLAPGARLSEVLDQARAADRPDLEAALLDAAGAELLRAPPRLDGEEGHDIRAGLEGPAAQSWRAGGQIRGWAWDRSRPERVLHVALLDGETPVAAVRADRHAPTLAARTPGLETHGFRIPVTGELLDGATGLQLVVLETGAPVRNGRILRLGAGELATEAEAAQE